MIFSEFSLTPDRAIQATILIAALAALLTSTELLAVRRDLNFRSLVDDRILTHGRPMLPRISPHVSWLGPIAVSQIFVSIAILLTWNLPDIHRFLVGIFPIGLVLQKLLLTYGGDGSDDMALVVSLPIAGAQAFPNQPDAQLYALTFVAAQLILCYFASGVAKFCGSAWRSGAAISDIMHTASWGFASIARLLDRCQRFSKIATWGVVLFEIFLPFGILAGGKVGLITLVMAAGFHIAVAALMGLNRFTLWFLAAYPATLLVMISWRGWVKAAFSIQVP